MEGKMDIGKTMKERQELMERLKDSLQKELVACEIREAEQKGEPEILRVLFDELGQDNEEGVLGEFYFLPPLSGEDEVQLFSAVLTISDRIDKNKLPELFEMMSYINFRIPCGSFSIDREQEVIVYRLTTPLSAEMEKEELFGEMNICMTNALVAADMYLDLLLRINAGEAGIKDVIAEMEGEDDQDEE